MKTSKSAILLLTAAFSVAAILLYPPSRKPLPEKAPEASTPLRANAAPSYLSPSASPSKVPSLRTVEGEERDRPSPKENSDPAGLRAANQITRANQQAIDSVSDLIVLDDDERTLLGNSLLEEPLLSDEQRITKVLGAERAAEFQAALAQLEQEGLENRASELSLELGTEIGLDIDEREELRQMYRQVGVGNAEGERERLWNLIRARFGERTLNRFIEAEEKRKPAGALD